MVLFQNYPTVGIFHTIIVSQFIWYKFSKHIDSVNSLHCTADWCFSIPRARALAHLATYLCARALAHLATSLVHVLWRSWQYASCTCSFAPGNIPRARALAHLAISPVHVLWRTWQYPRCTCSGAPGNIPPQTRFFTAVRRMPFPKPRLSLRRLWTYYHADLRCDQHHNSQPADLTGKMRPAPQLAPFGT